MRVTRIKLKNTPDSHLRGIGLVSLSFAYLDDAVQRVIWRASRLDDDKGASITTHMSLPQRLDAACTLVNHEFPDSEPDKKLPKLAKNIKQKLAPKRNEIVHNVVVQFGPVAPARRFQAKARGKLERGFRPVHLEDYDEIAADTLDATHEVRVILSEIIDLVTEKDGAPPP